MSVLVQEIFEFDVVARPGETSVALANAWILNDETGHERGIG